MSTNYYQDKNIVDEYIKMADGHDGKDLIAKFKDFIEENAHILELGTGPGSDWEIWNNTHQITGSDYSKEFIKRLKANFPKGSFSHLDAVSLDTTLKFDSIYSNKVLHHLTDDELIQSIKSQHRILNSKGIIGHSFWKGQGDEYFKEMFVNYQDQESLSKFIAPYFKLVDFELYNEFEKDDSIFIIAEKVK